MKNITLSITLLLLMTGFVGKSQSLQISNYTQTIYCYDSSATTQSVVTLDNTSSSTLNIGLTRTVLNITSGMDELFCFGPKCYPPNTAASGLNSPCVIPANGSDSSFKADVSPNGFWGSATINYHFYNQANSADSIGVTLNFVFTSATGLSENKADFGISHPLRNPADAFTVFNYNLQSSEMGDKMVLYNMLGSLVKTIDIPGKNGTLVVSTAELKAGVYFASYISGSKIKETYKLVVSHH